MRRLLPALIITGALPIILVLSQWRSTTLTAELEPEASGNSSSTELLEARELTANSNRRGAVADAEPSSSSCEFFSDWKARDCTPESVSEFMATAVNLEGADLECIPANWMALALLLNCDGALELRPNEVALFAREVSNRLPDPVTFSKTPKVDELGPSTLSCFVSSVLPLGAAPEEVGRIWAWTLMAAFGDEGDIFSADPAVVAALQQLMLEWPIHEDAWWEHLWAGLPGDPGQEPVFVRLALFEALKLSLPENEWLARLAKISNLERYDNVGGLSLWCMGQVLHQSSTDEEYLDLFAMDQGAEWQRSLILGFPGDLEWPNAGHARVSEETIQSLTELRDSMDYPFHVELLHNQWTMLGPESAVDDLERFVFDSIPNSPDWEFHAGLRIGAAIKATMVSSPFDGDSDLLLHAESLVRDLLLYSTIEDTQRVLAAIRDRRAIPGGDEKVWRERLAEVLGPGGLSAIGPEFRSWLES